MKTLEFFLPLNSLPPVRRIDPVGSWIDLWYNGIGNGKLSEVMRCLKLGSIIMWKLAESG